MKICIYGAGALGGFIGAKLSLAGSDVTLVARGPQLKAIQKNGITIQTNNEEVLAHPTAIEKPEKVGPQDYVIITLKAHSTIDIVDSIQPLLGPNTAVVWCVNGVPWWYFYNLEGNYTDKRLSTLDPENLLWNKITPQRVIGCVAYPAAEVLDPGIIKHVEGNRLSLGEPSGAKTDRVRDLSLELKKAGFKAPVRSQIRDEMWVKLWGNLSFNPISALTGSTLLEMCSDNDTRELIYNMMSEAQEIGEKLGAKFAIDINRRIEGGKAVGSHKTSMLQDLERRRPLEIDALIGAVVEMARITEIPAPNIEAILALVKLKASLEGCYPP